MNSRVPLVAKLVVAFVVTLLVGSCGGDGPASPSNASPPNPSNPPAVSTPSPVGSPTVQVLPVNYDFGKITLGNASAPLQVTIRNTGTASLSLSGITLNAPSGPPYGLAVGSGTKPCGSATPKLAPSEECTVEVLFQPSSPGTFNATLQVTSNDPKAPTVAVAIVGNSEPIQSLSIRIGQLDTACPSPRVTAYVSVTDQGGFPVLQLTRDNFAVMQTNSSLPIISSTLVESVNAPIAIAALMDHSSSLTGQPVALADMKTGLSSLIAGLGSGDIAEIITFDDRVVVVQPFTADKTQLQAAITAPFEPRSGTSLYDAAFQAVNDAATRSNYRRAVIITTDGVDTRSSRGLGEVVANAVAKKVPVFTIGIGSSIDRNVLGQMATGTGGQSYEANTSQNLATIYRQLSLLLYRNQYVITFDQLPKGAPNVVSDMSIRASLGASSDVATKTITSCN